MLLFSNHKALRKVSELEEQFDKLRRSFKELEMEWSSAHDKLLRLYQRIAKRHEAVVQREESIEQNEAAEPGPNEVPGLQFLSPKQRTIQQQIMARRRASNGRTQ